MNFPKLIPKAFYLLFLLTPLLFTQLTSEVFEFNKMIFVYLVTVFIAGVWVAVMIQNRKIILRRTILEMPLLLFLASQLISSIFSIDLRTSLLGYYGRFNGGLASTISYSILYFAFVTFMDKNTTKKALLFLLAGALLTSLWGILEHFGRSFSCQLLTGEFDVGCWAQDVQARVFATLGQPNWLAAYLTAIIPITWAFAVNSKLKIQSSKLQFIAKNYAPHLTTAIFYTALLFTKSRSGVLGFVVAFLVFWGYFLIKQKRAILRHFVLTTSYLLLATILIGTPWTPSINQLTDQQINQSTQEKYGTSLELGGTESGEIRKIVWKGASDIWRHYPIFGSGVETFAYSYFNFRPIEHNLTSEWDHTYNKAHNEFLNYAATTGTVGLLTYLLLISLTIMQIWKLKCQNSNVKTTTKNYKLNKKFSVLRYGFEICTLRFALLAGYASILVTNFFGFSVVTTSLLFFLFPAMAVCLAKDGGRTINYKFDLFKLSRTQKLGILTSSSFALLLFYSVVKYWYADTLYAKGQRLNEDGSYEKARNVLAEATNSSPFEGVYWLELANSSKNLAVINWESNKFEGAKSLGKLAFSESEAATSLSPKNVNFKRLRSTYLSELAGIDRGYLTAARDELIDAANIAPTDPKNFYLLALNDYKFGQTEGAIKSLEYAISLKPNYERARYTLALLYIELGETEKAKDKLKYILENIDPENKSAKRTLEQLEKAP